jgi:aspartate kinase
MIVSKFGGTSVQDSKAIKRVFTIVASKKESVFIVVSALSKVTDSLIKIATKTRESKVGEAQKILDDIIDRHLGIAEELGVLDSVNTYFEKTREELTLLIHALVVLGEVSPRSLDKIMSYGELMSSTLIFEYFRAQKLSIFYVDPRAVIKTNANFTEAEIDFSKTGAELSLILGKYGNKYQYFITGGFVGSDNDGNTTTLSRGGSDYTASVIASLLGAKKLEIWTDVPGVMTSDPRLIPEAKVISEVSYAEASELAFFGAKVLHPKTIYPAVKKKIPVSVLNSLRPDDEGTIILPTASKKRLLKPLHCVGI